MAKNSEQEKWEKILKEHGLSVGRGDTVRTIHVGSSRDLEFVDAKEFWDDGSTPQDQENANSTKWDKQWSSVWNDPQHKR